MGASRLLPLVHAWAEGFDAAEIDWAVGGALAMAGHGYTRETQDIDLFFDPDAGQQVIEILTKRGLHIEEIAAPYHFAFTPDRSRPDERIDLLFPSSQPDISAVVFPVRRVIDGRELPVWPIEHIVAAKLQAHRPKDQNDLQALWNLRLFDPRAVAEVVEELDDDEARMRLRNLCRKPAAVHVPMPPRRK